MYISVVLVRGKCSEILTPVFAVLVSWITAAHSACAARIDTTGDVEDAGLVSMKTMRPLVFVQPVEVDKEVADW